jgi:predicted Zn-dependent peptidase
MLFAGHPMGRNILGTPETVSTLTQQDIHHFIKENYKTNEIVIAVFGNYSFNKLIKIGSKHFESVPANFSDKKRFAPVSNPLQHLLVNKQIMQAHCMLGTQAYSLHHPYKAGLLLLNNMLGGTGMSSILNLQLREKYGIAYTIETNYSPLSDTGIFALYFGTDKEKVEKATNLIFKEFKKFRENPLTEIQLQKAKNKFIGQIALGEENRIGLIIAMAKSLIDYNKIDDLETVFNKIRAVTTADMANIANEILDEKKLSSLIFYPTEE